MGEEGRGEGGGEEGRREGGRGREGREVVRRQAEER